MKRLAAAALGGVLALVPAGARAGDLEVAVVVPDGKKLAGATLSAADQTTGIAGPGTHLMRGLPDKRIAVTVDAVAEGKGGVRYLGVADVKTLPGKTVTVTVTVGPVPDLEAFCTGCHPGKNQPVKPEQIVRDVHVSGLELTGFKLKQVEAYNAEAERQRKEKVKDPILPFVLEKRVVTEGGKKLEKVFYTCETCHTIHRPTVWTRNVRGPFRNSSVFCQGCH